MKVGMTIKNRLLLTLGLVAVLSSICMGVYSYQNQAAQMLHRFEELAEQQNQLFETILQADAEGLRRAISGLSRLEIFVAPFAAGDRAALLAVARPIFDELKSRHAITHMYFISPDGTVLLRVHKPEEYGDHLTRATYLKAAASRETVSGLEMGKNFFSLRCVTPVVVDDKLLGYLEVAEEIDHIFQRMKEITGSDIALFLPREYIERFDTSVAIRDRSDFAVLYPSTPHLIMPPAPNADNFLHQGLNAFLVRTADQGQTRYIVSAGPILDAFGDQAGVLFSQKNITEHYAAIWRGMAVNLAVFAIILASGILLLYLSIRRSMNFFLEVRNHIQTVTRTWDIDRRLEVTTNDEIGELAEDLNCMQTEIGKLKRSLIHQAEELAAANHDLESFSYTLSHDLRVPLTRAYGAAQLIEDSYGDRLDETGRMLLDNVVKGCEGMEDLIEAILVLTNIVRRELNDETFDLAAMARDIMEELAVVEPDRKVTIVIPEALTCKGDRQLLRVALRNLLENAWKYTRHVAEPRIELGRLEQEGKPAFYVRDNGIGFNMQYAAKLFTPFKRLHDASKYPGAGIGLATVQRIIQRHGGTVWGIGKEGEGATFFFTLP